MNDVLLFAARSIASKTKSDGSQVKESTDSSTTIEDEDAKGRKEQRTKRRRAMSTVRSGPGSGLACHGTVLRESKTTAPSSSRHTH